MTALRRALAVVPLGALAAAVAAAPAGAAASRPTPACATSRAQPTMTDHRRGLHAQRLVTLATPTKATPRPRRSPRAPCSPTGAFLQTTLPPPFSSPKRNLESFTLVGVDSTNPAAPLTRDDAVSGRALRADDEARAQAADVEGHVHRARLRRRASPCSSTSASAGSPGARSRSASRRAPCGIASKRMRALPTKARYGMWTSYTDQSRQFSAEHPPGLEGLVHDLPPLLLSPRAGALRRSARRAARGTPRRAPRAP